MHSYLIKYLSIFSLLIFLSPPVIEGMHDLQHSKAERCTEKTERHIHKEAHHCLLCGINVWISYYFTANTPDPDDIYLFNEFALAESEINISLNHPGVLLRAPPIFQILMLIRS
jgi:hypothetical protein